MQLKHTISRRSDGAIRNLVEMLTLRHGAITTVFLHENYLCSSFVSNPKRSWLPADSVLSFLDKLTKKEICSTIFPSPDRVERTQTRVAMSTHDEKAVADSRDVSSPPSTTGDATAQSAPFYSPEEEQKVVRKVDLLLLPTLSLLYLLSFLDRSK